MNVSFITLAAYDWRLLPTSIAAYHDVADEVLVGLDAGRKCWAGGTFDLDRSDLTRVLASFPKVRVVEDFFYDVGSSPIDNDTSERERLAARAQGSWIVEVDADEIVDGRWLVEELDRVPYGTQLYGTWVNIFKVIGSTALVVDDQCHLAPLATRSRSRRRSRMTGEPIALSDGPTVEHLTLGRSESDVVKKLTSWSHAHQVRHEFLDLWRSADLINYKQLRDVHPFIPRRWPKLKAVPLDTLGWARAGVI